MRHKEFVFETTRYESILEHQKTPYRFMEPKKFKTIAKWLWLALEKMEALSPYIHTVETFRVCPAKNKEIVDIVRDAVDQNFDLVTNHGAVICMGGVTFMELLQSPWIDKLFQFNVSLSRSDPYYGHTLFDVPVHVVPNVKGVAVIPRKVIEIEVPKRKG